MGLDPFIEWIGEKKNQKNTVVRVQCIPSAQHAGSRKKNLAFAAF
jgi:hypothetical protein